MKYIKRIFIGLLIMVVLSTAAVFILFAFYKKEIATMLTDSLKTSYGLSLKVDELNVSLFDNWPQASVQLKGIYLSNDSTGKTEPFIRAGSASISFNLQKLLQKQFIVRSVSLRDAHINMMRLADGSRNFSFARHDSIAAATASSSSSMHFEISKVVVKNSRFSFTNLQRGQHLAIQLVDNTITMKDYTNGLDIRLKGHVLVDELLFNPRKGAFMKHAKATLDLDMNYFKDTKQICIHPPSVVSIASQQYQVTSLIQLGTEQKLALYIAGKNIWYEKAASVLTPKMQKVLSNFTVKKPFDADVLLVASLGKGDEPIVVMNMEAKNSDLTIGNSKIPYSGLNFKGRIVSVDESRTCGNAEKARITFTPLSGKVYDFPFTASVTVTDLTNPQIAINGSLQIDASKISQGIGKELILNGTGTATFSYSGPTAKLNKSEFLGRDMHLDVALQFNNLAYRELSRPYVYKVNGKAYMNNRDLRFDNLYLQTAAGNAMLSGRAEGFVGYVFGYSKGLKASVTARADSLNLNPYLGQAPAAGTPVDSSQKKLSDYKDKVQADQSRFEFNVSLAAKKLIVRSVVATNARIDVFYKTNYLNVRSASMNICEGRITAKGTMEDFKRVNSEMIVEDVDVNKLFIQFGNFGQKAVVSENLQGHIYVDAKFRAQLNDQMEVMPESMVSEVKLKLKEGHLVNFEPVQNLSNFIFRRRDFNDVSFDELRETFTVKGYEMRIEELEIASNVLNLYVVNGIYNFKGNSNINLLIPWNNLKRRGKHYIPQSSGKNAEDARGVKLNVAGPNNKMKVSLGHKD